MTNYQEPRKMTTKMTGITWKYTVALLKCCTWKQLSITITNNKEKKRKSLWNMKYRDSPLIELPSVPHHVSHLQGFHKPDPTKFEHFFCNIIFGKQMVFYNCLTSFGYVTLPKKWLPAKQILVKTKSLACMLQIKLKFL